MATPFLVGNGSAANGSGVTSVAATIDTNTNAGDTIWVAVASTTGSKTVTGVSDTQGNLYTEVNNSPGNHHTLYLFKAINTTALTLTGNGGGPDVVTGTFATGSNGTSYIAVVDMPGYAGTDVAHNGSTTGSLTTLTLNANTLSAANDMCLTAFASTSSAGALTLSSGWTPLFSSNSAGGIYLTLGYQAQVNSTSATVTGTVAAVTGIEGCLDAFLAPIAPSGVPANPGQAWKKRFNYPKQNTVSTALSDVYTDIYLDTYGAVNWVPGPGTQYTPSYIQPGLTWRRNFNRIGFVIPSTTQSVPLTSGKVAKSSVVASAANTNVIVSESPAAITVAAHFGSIHGTNTNTALVTMVAQRGFRKVAVKLGSTATVSAKLGSPNIKITGLVSTVTMAAPTGGIGHPNTIYGYVVNVFSQGYPGTTVDKTTEPAAAITIRSSIGKVATNFHGSVSAVTVAAHMGTITASRTETAQTVFVNAEDGRVGAGCTITGLVSTATVAAHFGTIGGRTASAARINVAAPQQHHQVLKSGLVANVSVSAHFGMILVDPSETGHITVQGHVGTPGVSRLGKIAKVTSKSVISHKTSVSISPAAVTVAVNQVKAVSVSAKSSVTSAAHFGSIAVKPSVTNAGIAVVSPRQGTKVHGIAAQVTVAAHFGTINTSFTKTATVTVKAYKGGEGVLEFDVRLQGQGPVKLYRPHRYLRSIGGI